MLHIDVEPSSPSDSDVSPNEWLANGRSRRSNAGNRMTRLIGANEIDSAAEDDELNLLFAEDGQEDDGDFKEDRTGYSSELDLEDSTPDQSSESEDEFQGERELERENRVLKKRQRIPNLAQRYPRLKKVKTSPKSEASTLSSLKNTLSIPAAEGRDRQVRVSSRTHTLLSRRGAGGIVPESSIANSKPPRASKVDLKSPLTQEERLAKAHQIESQNSKSLHHWQDAENVRLQQQRDRLSDLRGRGIGGPVVRWYSGPAQFINDTPVVIGKEALSFCRAGQLASSPFLPKQPDHVQHLNGHKSPQIDLTHGSQDGRFQDGRSPERPEIEALQSPTSPNLRSDRTAFMSDYDADMLQASNSSTTPSLSISKTRDTFTHPMKRMPLVDYKAHKFEVAKLSDVEPLQVTRLQSDEQRKHLGLYNAVQFQGLKAEDALNPFIVNLASRRESRTRLTKPLVKHCSVTGHLARYRDPFTQLPFATPSSYHMIARLLCDKSRFNCDLGIYVGSAHDDSPLISQ